MLSSSEGTIFGTSFEAIYDRFELESWKALQRREAVSLAAGFVMSGDYNKSVEALNEYHRRLGDVISNM
jgi:hypothetical protein